jgi:AraC-like DNA-binding protein
VGYFSSREVPEQCANGWHQVVYASKGVITVMTPRGSWVVPSLRGVFVPSKTRYSLRLHGVVTMKSLFIREKMLRTFVDCFVLNVSALLKELVLYTVEKGFLRKSVPEEKRMVDIIIDLLKVVPVEPLQIPVSKDERLKRAVELFEKNPLATSSLELMANHAGTSKRTLERLVQNESGMSFGKWRQQLRLYNALKLLAEGHSVTNVALEIGYSTPSAFIYSFRQTFGTTPNAYFGG